MAEPKVPAKRLRKAVERFGDEIQIVQRPRGGIQSQAHGMYLESQSARKSPGAGFMAAKLVQRPFGS